jgi:chromosome segregation ATPase
MEPMTKSWTDERLEERFDRIDQRFDRLEADVRELRGDFRELRGEINSRFDATQRLIIQIGGGMFATLVIGFAGLIVTHL